MTWIKIIPYSKASEELKTAYEGARGLYPEEYAHNVPAVEARAKTEGEESIVASHSLLPKTLYHAFATFGTLLSPDLPLTRRQHEMIATTVSAINTCFY